MESNRCNFEQSKALKALGYKGKTKHFFKNGLAEESYYEWDKNDHREWLCTRPTVSDAIRWFRVERGMFGWVEANWYVEGFQFLFSIGTSFYPWKQTFEGFKSPDEAENALLNRLIEISNQV